MSGFSNILDDVKVGDAKAPTPLPEGSYIATIEETRQDESAQKGTPYVRVFFKIVSPEEDVDQEDIDAAGGIENIIGKKVRHDFFITDEALFIFQNFILDHVGLEVEGTFGEAIPMLPDSEVGIRIKHTIDKDNPEKVYANVAGTYKPE